MERKTKLRPGKPVRRRGFVASFTFIILLILAIFGVSYWSVSRLSTDQILKEAQRIKARNLAQAGIEKVMINIMNQYLMGNTSLDYPTKFAKETVDKEYEKDFGDGKYKVESVQIYFPPGSDKRMLNVPYFKNRVQIGSYDIWKIVAVGEIPDSKIIARVETLAKVIRNTVQY